MRAETVRLVLECAVGAYRQYTVLHDTSRGQEAMELSLAWIRAYADVAGVDDARAGMRIVDRVEISIAEAKLVAAAPELGKPPRE